MLNIYIICYFLQIFFVKIIEPMTQSCSSFYVDQFCLLERLDRMKKKTAMAILVLRWFVICRIFFWFFDIFLFWCHYSVLIFCIFISNNHIKLIKTNDTGLQSILCRSISFHKWIKNKNSYGDFSETTSRFFMQIQSVINPWVVSCSV